MRYTENDIKELENDISDYKYELIECGTDFWGLFKLLLALPIVLLLHGGIIWILSLLPAFISLPIVMFYSIFQAFLIPISFVIAKECDTADILDDFIIEFPLYFGSALLIPLLTLIVSLKFVFYDIPVSIYSLIKIILIKLKIDRIKSIIEENSNLNEVEEIKEKKEEKPKMNKEEDKKNEFETKVAQDIDALLQICKSIEGKKGIEFLDKLEDISHEFKTRYENISYNMNSKDIDLDQDNYEKLKSDIYGQIAIVGKDMMDYLEAQAKVNKVNSEMDIVIDNIDLLKKEKNQSLVLRR